MGNGMGGCGWQWGRGGERQGGSLCAEGEENRLGRSGFMIQQEGLRSVHKFLWQG